MRELVFLIEQESDGGFIARAADKSIFTQAEKFSELKTNIIEAVKVHLDPHDPPVRIRFQLERVRTLSLVSYLAAIYAWLLELGFVLLHSFAKVKFAGIGHIFLLATVAVMSFFAWRRREDFRALRGCIGHVPLTAWQMLVVVAFIIGFSLILTGVCILLMVA